MTRLLDNKTIIVTGAGGNIGRAYCDGLIAAGANLVMADLADLSGLAGEYQREGGRAIAVRVDVSDPASVQAMADRAVAAFGGIDGLVNNAGFFKGCSFGSFLDIPIEEWDLCFDVNVRGVWLCCKAVVPHMRTRGGKIINVSSNTPYKGVPNFLHYVSSKAAIIGLTRALAREVGEFNIQVNTLCPDLIPDADITAKQGSAADERTIAGRCLKRTQKPQDMVGSALFLLSDGADFVTGQSLLVNGGAFFN
ncbi:SDR family oxidoreductase [Cupriavidus taiwanensis]|uniref:SDR family NAD(P)-dependent oxidoreductase n=1 Tax=Cupriavidus taiwanensis TaxID=164546 RepID=UPI001571F6AD|nr:SDR family oxidoreductase [Cupriavidus taiwanensis]MDK3024114.1 SDR family oxidoreductase [Cupriavidus taiwanensis]NSX14730.1 SDR family oxidoreductase [Cupriavidus taiwanensis]